MYYKIGQIAKMMGVSPHLLKHYEKFGLIQPVKQEDSNYRYYELSQCAKIIECKKYRNMGFSLQEIQEILSQDSFGIEGRLEQRIETIQEEVDQLQFMQSLATDYLKECRYIENHLSNWYIETMEDSYFLPQGTDQMILENNSCQNSYFNLIENVPICKSMMHIKKDTASNIGFHGEWGLWIEKSKLDRINTTDDFESFELTENYQLIPARKVFVAYVKMELPYLHNGILLEKLEDLYHEFRAGEVTSFYSIVIKTTVSNEVKHQYLKLIVPL